MDTLPGLEDRDLGPGVAVALGVVHDAEHVRLGALHGVGRDTLASRNPEFQDRTGGDQHGEKAVDVNDRVTHANPQEHTRTRAGSRVEKADTSGERPRSGRRKGGEEKKPRSAVWGGRYEPAIKQVDPLLSAALQASSLRGMHTTRRRGSLRRNVGSNDTPKPSRTKQGNPHHSTYKRRLILVLSGDCRKEQRERVSLGLWRGRRRADAPASQCV